MIPYLKDRFEILFPKSKDCFNFQRIDSKFFRLFRNSKEAFENRKCVSNFEGEFRKAKEGFENLKGVSKIKSPFEIQRCLFRKWLSFGFDDYYILVSKFNL